MVKIYIALIKKGLRKLDDIKNIALKEQIIAILESE